MNLVKTQIPTSYCVLEKSSLLVICLATIGVAFFGALTSVGALFYLPETILTKGSYKMEKQTIQEVLNGALSLNGDDKKYVITVEENKIITSVKWMDAVLFAPNAVTDEMREFKFIAKLNDDNTWVEIDESKAAKKSIGASGMGMSYSSFKGKEISFNKTIAIGKKRNEDMVGVVTFEFNSQEYKRPVSEYLTTCGYKKTNKGFWAALFGR